MISDDSRHSELKLMDEDDSYKMAPHSVSFPHHTNVRASGESLRVTRVAWSRICGRRSRIAGSSPDSTEDPPY
ncbi:hypothetical protein TNCV_731411 [Trichonephila clavipes]|nr:hypothetical protein TNCV_731411 [Trichonephila clavipes]